MNSPIFPFFSPNSILSALRDKGGSPRKSLGQNYLIDRNTIDVIFRDINKSFPIDTEELAEIGIGLGAFTHKILPLNFPTTLFEIDPIACTIFREQNHGNFSNYNLIEGDCREHLITLRDKKVFLFGNLPYYITSEIMIDSLIHLPMMTGFLFMVQKEFADRILNDISSLSIFLFGLGTISKFRVVKNSCFFPAPKVDSTLLLFHRDPSRIGNNPNTIGNFSTLLRILFWGKRKKIITSAKEAPIHDFILQGNLDNTKKVTLEISEKLQNAIVKLGIENKRPEELKPNDFIDIFNHVFRDV